MKRYEKPLLKFTVLNNMKEIATMQSSIIKRAIGEKNFPEFYEQYRAAAYKARTVKEPNANDIRIANHVRKVQSIGRAARELGIDAYKVLNALKRVAVYNK